MPKRTAAALCALAITALPGAAGAEVYEIGGFTFESGETLEVMQVGYETFGELNEARDNAILVTHGTSGSRDSYEAYIGPGLAFDTERFYVVAVDAIGGGDSSKPSDELGTDFPAYNIRDMVEAQHRLVTEGLGIERLAAVGGASMGAFQALEWGIQHPDLVDNLLVVAGAPVSDRLFQGIIDTMIEVMQLDPRWEGGAYTTNPVDGILTAGMVFMPWLYSNPFMNALDDDDEYARQLRSMGSGWAESWDAVDWMYRYRAARSHDITHPFDGDMTAALGAIRARTLIAHVSSDRLFPRQRAERMHEGIADSVLHFLESDLGHMGCCQGAGVAEHDELSGVIRDFLDGEGAVPTE